MDGGRLVEAGVPAALLADPSSRYSALIRAERSALERFEPSRGWRRLRLDGGKLDDAPSDSLAQARRRRSAPVGSLRPDALHEASNG
jgi:ATP-binding cassette subfamily B protein